MGVMKRLNTARMLGGTRSTFTRSTRSASATKQGGNLVFVTGFAQLDAKLGAMEPKLQKKFARGALRRGAKRLVLEVQRILKAEAYDTGVLHKSFKATALKRSRKRIGVAIFPKRDVLFTRYAAKHGGKPPHPAAGEKEPFYYPAVIEFGSETHEAVKPMRRALYDNADVYQAYFRADMLKFIDEQKVTTALPKSGGYTGRKFNK